MKKRKNLVRPQSRNSNHSNNSTGSLTISFKKRKKGMLSEIIQALKTHFDTHPSFTFPFKIIVKNKKYDVTKTEGKPNFMVVPEDSKSTYFAHLFNLDDFAIKNATPKEEIKEESFLTYLSLLQTSTQEREILDPKHPFYELALKVIFSGKKEIYHLSAPHFFNITKPIYFSLDIEGANLLLEVSHNAFNTKLMATFWLRGENGIPQRTPIRVNFNVDNSEHIEAHSNETRAKIDFTNASREAQTGTRLN